MKWFVSFALCLTTLLTAGAREGWAGIITIDETTLGAFGTVNQANVPAGMAYTGDNSCVPTATMNSFTFLSNAYPNIYGKDANGNPVLMGGQAYWAVAAIVLASSAYMDTKDYPNPKPPPNYLGGTTDDNWIAGKVAWLNKFAPGKTIFEGMDSLSLTNRPAWVKNANPTADFLVSMAQKGEDVELGITPPKGIGHALTLTGLAYDDKNNNGKFDAGDTLTSLITDDPAAPASPGNTVLTLTQPVKPGDPFTINGGPYNGYEIDAAFAESPVPEPSSLILLLTGGASIGFCRARRSLRRSVAG